MPAGSTAVSADEAERRCHSARDRSLTASAQMEPSDAMPTV